MNYKEFSLKLISNILGTQVSEMTEFLGTTIALSEDGIYIDGRLSECSSINEAKHLVEQYLLEETATQEMYSSIPNTKIASLIKEYHNIKITNTIIESYLDLASSKTFSIDPVILELRSLNCTDNLLENKIDYVLNDNSVVAISEETQEELNKLLEDKYELVTYMQESKQNFMHVLRELY